MLIESVEQLVDRYNKSPAGDIREQEYSLPTGQEPSEPRNAINFPVPEKKVGRTASERPGARRQA